MISQTKLFSHTALIVMALFLGATFYAYAVSDEIRTVSGRSFMFLTVSLTVFLLSFPFMQSQNFLVRRLVEVSLAAGFVFSFLWLNVLVFDIFWTFKNFRAPIEGLQQFKFYCYYVIGLSSLFCVTILLAEIVHTGFRSILNYAIPLAFFGSIALDVIFLLVTSFMIFKISMSSNLTEHTLFVRERDR